MTRPTAPSYGQWRDFLKARQGLLPIKEHENVKVLCLACGIPTDLSAAMPVTVGCVVKMAQVDEIQIGDQVFEELKTKYMPMSKKGHGCITCHCLMTKIETSTARSNLSLKRNWGAWIEIDPRRSYTGSEAEGRAM